jgi:replicative DNA helicase
MADLRGSGGIEQDADIVMMIYRPGYYEELQDMKKEDGSQIDNTEAQLLIEKQRNGPTGTVRLLWNPESACFVSRDTSDREAPQNTNYYENEF